MDFQEEMSDVGSDDNCTWNQPTSNSFPEKEVRFQPKMNVFNTKTNKKANRLDMTYGFVRFRPGSSTAEKMTIRKQQREWDKSRKDKMPKVIPDTFGFNSTAGKGIGLYGSQLVTLVKHLPDAYQAFEQGLPYYFVIDKTKTSLLTLEIATYNDQTNVSLKKFFKPEDKADDPDQDFIASGQFMHFDPDRDDPEDILEFALKCTE